MSVTTTVVFRRAEEEQMSVTTTVAFRRAGEEQLSVTTTVAFQLAGIGTVVSNNNSIISTYRNRNSYL